jgi:predicted permease
MAVRLDMDDLIQDLHYGLRQIRRSPGFFGVAALLVALGIAATTQIFTLVDALLLRPLPVRDPQNLIQLFEQQPRRPAEPFFDYHFYTQLGRYSSTLFEIVGQLDTTRALERTGHVERVHAVAVTNDFFASLGVTPLLGRVLGRNDSHVAVLSYACWSRSFGRDPSVLTQLVKLQGHGYSIVGVAPKAFTGTTVDSSPDLWIPFVDLLEFSRMPKPSLDLSPIEIIARLRPGTSEAQAQQETSALWDRYMPSSNSGLKRGRLEVRSIANGISPIRDQSKTALVLLLAGTGLLLLMVCANVGGLLLSRMIARERETAVRIALGASRGRILRQWLMESLLLTLIGWCSGVLIAYASLPILMRSMPPAHGIGFDPGEIRTLTLHFALDLRIAGFSLVVFLLTVLLCTLAPAWRSWRSDINPALKSTSGDPRSRLLQAALCGVQIALCTTLLLCAGLIIRSLSNLRATDAGFDRDRVTVFSIDPHVRGYDGPRTWSFQQRLMNEVRNLPGVDGVALAERGLMRGIGLGSAVVLPGRTGDGIINASFNSVSPEYFGVMGMHLLAGRNFGPSDMAEEDKLAEVIVNDAFARKFLNGRNPLGAKFATGRRFVKPQYEVIGLVNDSKYRSLREVPPPIFYTYGFGPNAYPDAFILHVRNLGDPHAIIEPVRQLVRSIDPELPLYQVATLSEEVDHSLWQERLLVTLTSCFGAFALLLSSIGLYGIMAYFVARRQREIGLYMALGARSRDVIWLVVRRVIPTFAIGVVAGAALSSLVSEWVRSLLYGVQPFDPATDIALILLFIAIVSGTAALPALRAIRVDPASTLRQE